MTPPIQKDWWLAAALTGAALPSAMGQAPTAADGRQASIVTTVTQGAATPGGSTPIYIDNTRGQKLVTGPNQTLHVLFSDQSAMTLGPNSEVTIAEYRYDPKVKDGNVLVDMTKGLLRVVGGFISKKSETVVRTGTATIGIRGGIATVSHQNNQTSATFSFGTRMTVTDSGGSSQVITRQGFGVDITGNSMSPARQFTGAEMQQMNANFETQPTGQQTGGSQQPGGAPPGQLLSTGDRPGGTSNPGGTLANDRLKNVVDADAGNNPSEMLKTLLGTGQIQNLS